MYTLRNLTRWTLMLAIMGIVGLAFSATAKADIVVVTGVNNQGTDNVLLNPATDVTYRYGHSRRQQSVGQLYFHQR